MSHLKGLMQDVLAAVEAPGSSGRATPGRRVHLSGEPREARAPGQEAAVTSPHCSFTTDRKTCLRHRPRCC